MFITQAGAQYRSTGDDGIAASPKARQMLEEHKRLSTKTPAAAEVACCQAPVGKGTATSPKSCGQCCKHCLPQVQAAAIK
jgi:hypothetical protein